MFLRKKGQGALEYAVLLAVIVAAIVIMQVYVKRGIQGRFRESTDDIGEQYDPGHQDYISSSKSTSTIHETTDTAGLTKQATEDADGNEVPQKTLRWGKTVTDPLHTTEWGTPTR